MAKTQWNLSPVKEIYCINCHEQLILNPTERKGGEIICPKCKASFCLQEAIDFLRNMSPILEGQCPSCWEDLTFNIEDRTNKDKVECPICNHLFYMTEVLNPSSKITKSKEIKEKKLKIEKKEEIKRRTNNTNFSEPETKIPKGIGLLIDIILAFVLALFSPFWNIALLIWQAVDKNSYKRK